MQSNVMMNKYCSMMQRMPWQHTELFKGGVRLLEGLKIQCVWLGPQPSVCLMRHTKCLMYNFGFLFSLVFFNGVITN